MSENGSMSAPVDAVVMQPRGPVMHELKTWPEYFRKVVSGDKTFEIRKNDRDYQVGDMLSLYEWCPEEEQYTKECVIVEVTYITDFGQPEGQVVMAIRNVAA